MELELLSPAFSVCRTAQPPDRLGEFSFYARTDRECSLVCPTGQAPRDVLKREDGWRAFRFTGTLDFSLTGVLAGVSAVLAEEKIGIFAVSTYETDYIFVRCSDADNAAEALSRRGYRIRRGK